MVELFFLKFAFLLLFILKNYAVFNYMNFETLMCCGEQGNCTSMKIFKNYVSFWVLTKVKTLKNHFFRKIWGVFERMECGVLYLQFNFTGFRMLKWRGVTELKTKLEKILGIDK